MSGTPGGAAGRNGAAAGEGTGAVRRREGHPEAEASQTRAPGAGPQAGGPRAGESRAGGPRQGGPLQAGDSETGSPGAGASEAAGQDTVGGAPGTGRGLRAALEAVLAETGAPLAPEGASLFPAGAGIGHAALDREMRDALEVNICNT